MLEQRNTIVKPRACWRRQRVQCLEPDCGARFGRWSGKNWRREVEKDTACLNYSPVQNFLLFTIVTGRRRPISFLSPKWQEDVMNQATTGKDPEPLSMAKIWKARIAQPFPIFFNLLHGNRHADAVFKAQVAWVKKCCPSGASCGKKNPELI